MSALPPPGTFGAPPQREPPHNVDAEQALLRDTYTSDRLKWLDQVMADREVTPFAFCVAFTIASHVSQTAGEASVGQAEIASVTGGGERGVRGAIHRLECRGHLTVTAPAGRKRGNRYRLFSKGAKASRSGCHL